MSNATQRIAKSKQRFENIVWPEIGGWFGGADLVPVESIDTQLAEVLDTDAGVDWLAAITGRGVVAIGSRVQKTTCFETTTIRAELDSGRRTELQKRLEQVRRGMVIPTVTVHSYVELSDPFDKRCVSGTLRNLAVHPTAQLVRYIDEGEEAPEPARGVHPWEIGGDYYIKTNSQDGNRFAAVPWRHSLGEVPIRVWDRDRAESLPQEWQSPLGPRPTFGGGCR